MSRVMADLCKLLKIKQLRTTVYHPQTDGLVERFNQTLKLMLRRVAAEDKRDWDKMLPYVLFGIRDVPQVSTGFTPFELLFGRQPRGLLDVGGEAWEQQPAVHCSTIEHVREMRERIDRVMPIVREHMAKVQQAQQRHYNRAAQPREFQPGDHVMVLVPTTTCKFLASWQGPYTVTERIGPVTYRVRQPGRRREDQLYHVNLLKCWVGTGPQLAALAHRLPVAVDMDPHLSAAQNGYLMPRVDELLDRLGRARYISTLDLTKGYWQVPLTEQAKPKMAFSTPSGHWQYRVLPFGLHGAPATFQRLMDILLRPHQAYTAAYLDDVVIHSETWEEHLERLRKVLSELRGAGLTANPRKCHLALTEAKYRVGRGLIRPQEKKVAATLSAPRPTTKTQVRAFLGLVGYYRCFIPNFSSLASPLTDLTRKGQPEKVPWNPETESAFHRVKAALTSEPVLRAPDFNRPFLVQTDASDTGLGAVLSQVIDSEEHPVIYISRKLTSAERRYAAVEKEALAIKWAVLELHYYLLGRQFTLITDHAPLQWMARAKDTNARVTRWFFALQDFHFTVQHRAGTANANADGLSRIWSAFAGLSGSTPRPPPISPLLHRDRTTLWGGGV
uniref:ribonuclease H n=1 Tax=Cyprinus carpio carpio TaxID=630221 RepID=A0A9J7WVK0_CYPCA